MSDGNHCHTTAVIASAAKQSSDWRRCSGLLRCARNDSDGADSDGADSDGADSDANGGDSDSVDISRLDMTIGSARTTDL